MQGVEGDIGLDFDQACGQTAAGIMVATQNSGLSSLIQQSINVQANVTLR